MSWCTRQAVEAFFYGKSVAIVGSGPGVLDNEPGFIDSHDIVVRVNNHRCLDEVTGRRTDAHYSFYGTSIKKTAAELREEGVRLCLCKCPPCDNGPFIRSEWHVKNKKLHGIDFRYIYDARKDWWFTSTYVPSHEEFMASFNLLNQHIPSTGFSAILLIKGMAKSIYLTGFDFFASRIHNVNEPWRPGNPDDPIGHAPELERKWLAQNLDGITLDRKLTRIVENDGAVLV